ncbi:UNVERIFIED_CONTAM: hypothetical protein K2H54_056203 [Gekko kuhli]
MSGTEREDTSTTPVTMGDQLVTEVPVTTGAPITTAPVMAAPICRYPTYLAYPMVGLGQLTQWGQFHPDSTAETYLLTEGLRHDSRWDLQGQSLYQPMLEEGAGETSSVWLDPRPTHLRTLHEEQVELEDDDLEKDDDQWGTRLANLEKGQQVIQRNLEEVMLTIPEIVIRAIRAECEAERQREDQQRPPTSFRRASTSKTITAGTPRGREARAGASTFQRPH